MEIIFYGTRGSTPVSGKEFMGYGGNTTCIAVKTKKQLLIVDCGTGMQRLHQEQFSDGKYKRADILLTHLHWDHIQGIAFFEPFYNPECSFAIYGESREEKSIQEQVESIMRSPMFPVNADTFLSDISYHTISCGDCFLIGDIRVGSIRLDHPNVCTGYQIECEGKTICIMTDCETYSEEMKAFAKGADLLVCDGQYTKEEYKKKQGWGHASWEAASSFAAACMAEKTILTHHDSEHTDELMNRLQEEAAAGKQNIFFAYDGMKWKL